MSHSNTVIIEYEYFRYFYEKKIIIGVDIFPGYMATCVQNVTLVADASGIGERVQTARAIFHIHTAEQTLTISFAYYRTSPLFVLRMHGNVHAHTHTQR